MSDADRSEGTMKAHTPGPWKSNHFLVVAPNAPHCGPYGGAEIAHTGCVGNQDVETSEANARLIAAAPELLEACEHAQHALYYFGRGGDLSNGEGVNVSKLLRDAINKAKHHHP